MLKANRLFYSCSASALALLAVSAGAAQAADQSGAQTTGSTSSVAEVVVTGSRITARGFSQPTPTTVLTARDLQKVAEPNVFDAIKQLPAVQGSTGNTVNANSTSSGQQGLSSFSLRGLGTIRTLTLLDGQRVTPANVTGVTDVSEFPQLLVQRVDVVTGGASASYGSDAVGGVVNFITEKKFEGFKANIEGGETTYGDDGTFLVQAAAGKSFLNDKLHVEVSGEYDNEGGVGPGAFGSTGADGRTWFVSPQIQQRSIGQTPAGQPQYNIITHGSGQLVSDYGLITSGPLKGTAFGANGTPYQFQYGSNCIGGECIGGDQSADGGDTASLAGRLRREDFYTRVGYDLDANNEIYLTTNLASVRGQNDPNLGAVKPGNLTIQCSNPFVPASVQAACATNNITSFQFGTNNADFPNPVTVNEERDQVRFVLGADGRFDFLGKTWSYDGYFAYGQNRTDLNVNNVTLTPRYNAAINAVSGPNGAITCASPVAVAAGCVPLNVIGQVALTPSALAYVMPENGPYQHSLQKEDVLSFNLHGQPFSTWAGPVAIATGAEYREESYKTLADPYGNGVSADSPNNALYPADPLLNPGGNNWYAGNYHDGQGYYNVIEGYVEASVPLLHSATVGDVALDTAVREAAYSTAGDLTTWKLGGTWKTPLSGLSFRAVSSRDARAPNLSELFSPAVVTNQTVTSNGTVYNILDEQVGNTKLRPETSRNTELGVVLNHPQWLPGFSASFDYYDIKIANEVSSISAQGEVDLCAEIHQMCQAISLISPTSALNFVKVQSFNLASVTDKGFDVEGAYRFNLDAIKLPGAFTVRALATHTISFLSNEGIPGTTPVQSAGGNLGNTPYWKANFTESWDTDKFSVSLIERWISDGLYNPEYIQCATNCPVSTINHPTINNNVVKGALYLDVGASYNFTPRVVGYFKVDNIFDVAPAPYAGGYTDPNLYDVLGRTIRTGVRLNF